MPIVNLFKSISLRKMILSPFYLSKVAYTLPLMASRESKAMQLWQSTWLRMTKRIFNLHDKTATSKVWAATGTPNGAMMVRKHVLRTEKRMLQLNEPMP